MYIIIYDILTGKYHYEYRQLQKNRMDVDVCMYVRIHAHTYIHTFKVSAIGGRKKPSQNTSPLQWAAV